MEKSKIVVSIYPVKVIEHGEVVTLKEPGLYKKCVVCGRYKLKSAFGDIARTFNYRPNGNYPIFHVRGYQCSSCFELNGDQIEKMIIEHRKYHYQSRNGDLVSQVDMYNDCCSNSVTVSELIKKLEKLPQNAKVFTTYRDEDDRKKFGNLSANPPEQMSFDFLTEVELFEI